MLYQLAGIVKLNQNKTTQIHGLIEVFIIVLASVGRLDGFSGLHIVVKFLFTCV